MGVNGFFGGIRQQKYHVNHYQNVSTKTEGPVTSDNRTLWANHLKSAVQINEKPTLHAAADKKKTFTGTVARRVKHYQAAGRSNVERQHEAVNTSRTTETLSVLEGHFLSAATSAMLALGRDPSALLDQTRQKLHAENRALTKQDLQEAKTLKPLLIDGLTREFIKQGFPEKEARTHAKQAFATGLREVLNTRKWETVDTRFQHNNVDYRCKLTPAGQMKQGGNDVFHTPYNDKGVASSSSQETAHATNLWLSEFSVLGEKGSTQRLFSGIRHGTLSPYGLAKNSDARYFGAQTRAMEVVTAALFARPELLRDAEQGKTVGLNLASTSLVTGGIGAEKEMMDDQMQAWAMLSQQQPLQVPLRDAQGNSYHASVNLNVAAFNFGVNEFALIGNMGWKQADGYNEAALKTLLGNDLSVTAPPKGWVGDYLAQHPTAENAQKVRTLSQQLKAIWANKTHHRDGGEPYKAALRVALLANEIGAMPCWNCKSGKDRTGMLDAEIKREAVKMHQHDTGVMPQASSVSVPGRSLDSAEQQLLRTILLHGGNSEVQQYNTGVPGNKVAKPLPGFLTLSTRQRIGDAFAFKNTQGLSELV
ncbi:inositol phosphate phosphatase SopB [Candidatus Symbiopectobacterium sp. NZEC151]|uniref:inositol phosphate phosphatase SopB n=3 Tax=unclassified Symbiopectobacterium TaxID=2794573 RepID=UPI002226BEF3|nr:inositol phosphate phosphatase SopB [Candidatus Symbiopectobacterium sp. NZEC151]MCW2473679.1 inositol phosphatase [Candidatus Symbiopectobacterium sp. NZEC151]